MKPKMGKRDADVKCLTMQEIFYWHNYTVENILNLYKINLVNKFSIRQYSDCKHYKKAS